MIIKNVTIGYLNEKFQTGMVSKGKMLYRFERENVGKKICIIDNDKAIDIDDFNNEYEIIRRDEYNRIENDVDILTQYAFEMEDVDTKTARLYKKRVKQYKKINN